MYNNIKESVTCSFDNTCIGYIENKPLSNEEIQENIKATEIHKKEQKLYIQKAQQLNHHRCVLFGHKSGTSNYAHCRDSRDGLFEMKIKSFQDDAKEAYLAMVNTYKNDEDTCTKYGVKRKSPEFVDCIMKFEKQRLSRPISGPSTRCTTTHLNGISFTDCN